MKKVLALLLSIAVLLALGAAPALAQGGTFAGSGDSKIGGAGSVAVEVTLDDSGVITDVKVTANNDTPGVSDPAVEKIPAAIVEAQSVAVDAVSGATMTSDAILAAVTDALTKAGVDLAQYSEKKEAAPVEKAEDVELTADVAVIGGGGAGLAAAVQANQNGATVVVVEKMSKVGGNTTLAGGALNAVDDRSETAIANNDSVEWHYTQTIEGGDNQGDPVLVHTLVSNAWDGVEWLKDMGMEFQDGVFTVTGGLWPRAHKPWIAGHRLFQDLQRLHRQP
jgi:fumarate reductase flavoprotein subunit